MGGRVIMLVVLRVNWKGTRKEKVDQHVKFKDTAVESLAVGIGGLALGDGCRS